MKQLLLAVLISVVGCSTPDPMVTGKPQDWRGRPAVDLRTAWGEPTRIIPQSNGDEVWEYRESSDFVIPKGENINLGFGGLGSDRGGGGAFSMEKRPEDRIGHEVKLYRFKIRAGKIEEWYAARIVNGRTVWEDN